MGCASWFRRESSIRTLVHLSDLHFGAADPDLLPHLLAAVAAIAPDISVVSGDFTQRAWPEEFQQARAFVEQLPGVPIFVPGNHDLAFYNPLRRALQRLRYYKRYITSNLQPWHFDAEVAILGLNTSRVRHLRDGRIRHWQVDVLEEQMAKAAPGAIKVLVTHHPFDLPESYALTELIGRDVMERVVRSVDLLLAGHMHVSYSGATAMRYKIAGSSAIFVQAGTAISSRMRGEANSFQVIRLDRDRIETVRHDWDGAFYVPQQVRQFERSLSGWRLV